MRGVYEDEDNDNNEHDHRKRMKSRVGAHFLQESVFLGLAALL